MADVVISTPDITVLGGPAKLEVQTNIGARGDRGNFIYLVNTNPNQATPSDFPIGITVKYLDVAIVSNPNHKDYSKIYQLVDQANDIWVEAFKIVNDQYGTVQPLTFIDGKTTFSINVTDITEQSYPSAGSDFSITCTIEDASAPVAQSITVDPVIVTELGKILTFDINAAKFDGTAWTPLDGIVTVNIQVSVARGGA